MERVIPSSFNNVSLSVHGRGLWVFSVRFESVLIYFHVAQSVLARGSLTYVFAPVPSDSLVSTALQVMASTLDHAQLLGLTWAGARRYLKSMMDTYVVQA